MRVAAATTTQISDCSETIAQRSAREAASEVPSVTSASGNSIDANTRNAPRGRGQLVSRLEATTTVATSAATATAHPNHCSRRRSVMVADT